MFIGISKMSNINSKWCKISYDLDLIVVIEV